MNKPFGALDRYLLIETIRPLTVGLGIVLSALLLERMLRLFDLLVNKGGPLVLVLKNELVRPPAPVPPPLPPQASGQAPAPPRAR